MSVSGEDSSCENLRGAGLARGLSSRELAILRTLMEGASNKVIARTLVITEATVKVHMKSILRKLRLQIAPRRRFGHAIASVKMYR